MSENKGLCKEEKAQRGVRRNHDFEEKENIVDNTRTPTTNTDVISVEDSFTTSPLFLTRREREQFLNEAMKFSKLLL